MVKPELGTKRLCTECGVKFYDLMKDPIVCPKCGTTYQIAAPTPARASAAKVVQQEVEAPLPVEEAAELVSLEDAEAEQASTGAKGAKLPEDEVDVDEIEDDDDTADDTFLVVDDEDDPDVSDLIDKDIDENEEET